MKVTAILLMAAMLVAACSENVPPVPSARKEVLRQILEGKFALSSVPADKEEDFYRILDVFDRERRPDELVRRVEFSSGGEANLWFSDRGMHGGGTATLKKSGGKWKLDQKWYFM